MTVVSDVYLNFSMNIIEEITFQLLGVVQDRYKSVFPIEVPEPYPYQNGEQTRHVIHENKS